MLTNEERAAVMETRQRVTRLESRLCRMAEQLGVVVREPSKNLRVLGVPTDSTVSLHTNALDVTVSEVLSFLSKEGIDGKVATLYHNSKLVARIYPESDHEREDSAVPA